MYQIIPSAAFESYREYRQVKVHIKRRIKQQRGPGKQLCVGLVGTVIKKMKG